MNDYLNLQYKGLSSQFQFQGIEWSSFLGLVSLTVQYLSIVRYRR